MALAALRKRTQQYETRIARTSNKRPATSDQQVPPLNEATLTTLWSGQRFPESALVTREGVPLRVLHPGRAGRGAGPDFRDAIIAPARGPVLRGDVELHVRASDFRAHGHHADRAYAGVVLHLVFEDDAGEDTLLANGRRALVVALASWVDRRAQELQQWLSAPRLWREPCHDAVARLGPEELLAQLDAWGDDRFADRVAAIAQEIAALGAPRALFDALAGALGYGGNRTLMVAFAVRAPWPEIAKLLAEGAPQQQIEGVLLASAGTLLEGHSGRPANHPARRIAGLATLLARHRELFKEPPGLAGALGQAPAALIAAFTVAPLIGRSRAVELLTNALLPWSAALGAQRALAERASQPALVARARALYAELPRPARYGALAFLEQNLRVGNKPLPLTARGQQGLLALYKSECTQGGCGRCAFSS